MSERVAIIDLGTNTFHLLIATREGGKPRILHREKQPVKLGLKGINQNRITSEAIQRALLCLSKFNITIAEFKVTHIIAIGTSALRSAENGMEVITTIKLQTGIDVRLISGLEEAEYIYHGICAALDLGIEKSLIVDIGGGSVECIIANQERIFWKQSFEIGAQRLLELFHHHEPITAEEVNRLNSYFTTSLAPLAAAINKFAPMILVGSSGTFDTLSEIYCVKENISLPPDQPETPLTTGAFHKIHSLLISKTREERMRIPGMIEMRVDMIVVASCLVKYLLDKFSLNEIRVSSYSLKEGVLSQWAKRL